MPKRNRLDPLRGVWQLGCLTLLFSAAAANAQETCADSRWETSLRCHAAPLEVPQPIPSPPTAPAQIRDYTRVDLAADSTLRCLDGTVPVLYVDPAEGGPSNRWLITFAGGGSCYAADSDSNGTFDDGQDCAERYFAGEAGEMGTAAEPAMKDLGDDPSGGSDGILKPSLATNPVFARFHRIRIEKCSFDRHQGRATHTGVTATPLVGAPFTYDLHQHGQRIVLAALAALRGQPATGTGLSYTTWIAAGGLVVPEVVALPPLESASLVLFDGHSGGAHGLYQQIDRYADLLRGWTGFSGEVRAVFDANFLTSPENEAAFDPLQSGDLWDGSWAGSSAELGDYDGELFYSDSIYVDALKSWLESPVAAESTLLDSSCFAAHAASVDTWKCRDRNHVLYHHLTTPAFLREDLSDPNSEHTASGNGHVVLWGTPGAFPHCPGPPGSLCPPLLQVGNPSPYRDRLLAQATTFLAGARARSELATGADSSGPVPTFYLWMPDCGSHAGAFDERHFYDVALTNDLSAVTLRAWLESFVAAPATGVMAARIDGYGGDVSRCQGWLPFADGFESGDRTAWSATIP